jgi:ATP-dependent RNA helicase DDX51/DBP6
MAQAVGTPHTTAGGGGRAHDPADAGAPDPAIMTTAAAAVLPWMRVPISIPVGAGVPLAQVHGVHPALMAALQQQLGFSELFPVQVAVWRSLAGGASSAHDMCICAPTGSGKTLAYALPLLNAILTTCVRADALGLLPCRQRLGVSSQRAHRC